MRILKEYVRMVWFIIFLQKKLWLRFFNLNFNEFIKYEFIRFEIILWFYKILKKNCDFFKEFKIIDKDP